MIKLSIKLNKTLTELLKEPLNYLLATYHIMEYEEQMQAGARALQYYDEKFKNNNKKR